MFQAQISTLASILEAADTGAADRCETMYQAKFRSVPFVFSSLDDASQEDLAFAAKEQQAAKLGIVKPESEDDYEMERYFDMVCDFEVSIDDGALIVELCNYKGEGEGFAMFEDAKHLPVFASKRDSAMLFGA